MKKYYLNENFKKLIVFSLIIIFVTQILLITALSSYRNFTYSDYNESFLEQENFDFIRNDNVCNLTYKEIKPELNKKYNNFNFKLLPDTKYLRSDLKSIRCIGTVSYIEINTQENLVKVYVGTSKETYNFISIIFSLLFLRIKKTKKNFSFFYIFYIFQHFISYNYFFSSANWQEIVFESSTRTLLIFCLDVLINMDFYSSLNVKKNSYYRTELDGLRAISVIFVILNHLNSTLLPFGYLGVDIFFVLSGYVISSSLNKKNFNNFSSFIVNFYVKRFKRLYPTLFLTVIFTYLMFYSSDYYFLSTYMTGLYSLFGLSNLYLYNSSLEYFSTTARYNPLLHSWSLGVEEQFYFVFPFILFYFVYHKKNKKQFKFVTIVLFLSSLVYFLYLFDQNFNGAYYLTQSRIWQILLGVIIFIFQNHSSINIKFDKNIIVLIFIFLFTLFGFKLPINPHIVISILTGLILIKSNKNSYSDKVLNTKLLTNIGIISYALYLWHLPFFTLKYWNNNIFSDTESEIVLILFLSIATFYFIDIPIRVKGVAAKFKKRFIVSFFIITFALVSFYTNPSDSFALTESVDLNETPVYKLLDCHLPEDINQVFKDCLKFQNETKNVILLGDSHVTNHYFPIEKKFKNVNVGLLVDWSFIGSFVGKDLCVGNRVCTENGLDDYINVLNEKLLPNDIVILAFTSSRVSEGNKAIFNENLTKLINVVEKNKSEIYLVDDIPKPCLNTDLNYELEVLVKRQLEICTMNKQFSRDSRGLYSEIIQKYSNMNSVIYIDPHDTLCSKDQCNLAINNVLLYADTSPHLTKVGTDYLNEFWSSVFRQK